MAKLGILVGLGAGYVLGSRAGRQRYDQMKETAQAFWSDPRVQKQATRAQDVVQEKATHAAGSVTETVKDKVPGFGTNDHDVTSNTAPTR